MKTKQAKFSRDGRTFLSCGGMPSPLCDCNGCRWERGDTKLMQFDSHEDAIQDRSKR